jgi:hypothetical protein
LIDIEAMIFESGSGSKGNVKLRDSLSIEEIKKGSESGGVRSTQRRPVEGRIQIVQSK